MLYCPRRAEIDPAQLGLGKAHHRGEEVLGGQVAVGVQEVLEEEGEEEVLDKDVLAEEVEEMKMEV